MNPRPSLDKIAHADGVCHQNPFRLPHPGFLPWNLEIEWRARAGQGNSLFPRTTFVTTIFRSIIYLPKASKYVILGSHEKSNGSRSNKSF